MRIALVEYLNTYPFSSGMQMTGFDTEHVIHRVIPAQCAALYKEGNVDVSLCPVGALGELPAYDIVGKYCIGADGPVKTVMLLSKVPLDEITAVRLDDHSRTSNLLLQILAQRHWKKAWSFYRDNSNGSATACIMIGDKVFDKAAAYPYQYDLAAAWKELTGLPMVFAVWIATPGLDEAVVVGIDEAFTQGMRAIADGRSSLAPWQIAYLTESISYPLDAGKREALALFTAWAKALVSSGSTG
jgi:chorismate dehydratase